MQRIKITINKLITVSEQISDFLSLFIFSSFFIVQFKNIFVLLYKQVSVKYSRETCMKAIDYEQPYNTSIMIVVG